MNETKKSNGCTLAAVLIGLAALLVLAVPVGLFWLFSARMSSERTAIERVSREMATLAAEGEPVTIDADSQRRYSPSDLGGGLTREHFAALMADQNATALTRQTFVKNASGQTVRWLLKTNEVQAAPEAGPLSATFELPYRIQSGASSWSGSSLMIAAQFPAAELERLANLRRNDWAMIEGRLEIQENNAFLLRDAKLIVPAAASPPGR